MTKARGPLPSAMEELPPEVVQSTSFDVRLDRLVGVVSTVSWPIPLTVHSEVLPLEQGHRGIRLFNPFLLNVSCKRGLGMSELFAYTAQTGLHVILSMLAREKQPGSIC